MINNRVFVLLVLILPTILNCQVIDKMIDVGNHKLHFKIIKGDEKLTPILFEAGSGNDADIWKDLLQPLHEITSTTLINYSRVGMGKSSINQDLKDNEKGLISHGVKDLEIGLEKLGYNRDIILVSHSYGGLYSAMFAANNPKIVKGIVLIDTNIKCYYTDKVIDIYRKRFTSEYLQNLKELNIGVYYESLALEKTIDLIKKIEIPANIPLIDIISENSPTSKDKYVVEQWKNCHKKLVKNNLNRANITVFDSGHYIFFDNPALVIEAIVKIFLNTVENSDKISVLEKSLDYSIKAANSYRQKEYKHWHSEYESNNWGYSFLNNKQLDIALSVFKLNILLFPNSANVYDSYAEALLKAGNKIQAIEMYKKSLELEPNNENAKNVLMSLANK